MSRALAITFIVCVLATAALAVYPPIFPLQGSYTWEVVIAQNNVPITYTGGRTIFDYVSGYVRLESWDTPDANPGINGVSIWDMREQQPIVTTIDDQLNCYVEKLDSNNTAPMPPDWTGFSYAGIKYFNRALAEEWSDGYGGLVYVDTFSRTVVGMGNSSTADDGDTIFYNVQSWTDKKPDGTEFLLPNTIPCKPLPMNKDSVARVVPHAALFGFGLKCITCKLGVGLILGRLCGGAGAAACAAFPPAVPFCAVLSSVACKAGANLSKSKACQIIKMC